MHTKTSSFRSRGVIQTQSGVVTATDIIEVNEASLPKLGWPGLQEISREHIAYYLDGRQAPHPIGQQGHILESIWEFTLADDTKLLSEILQSL